MNNEKILDFEPKNTLATKEIFTKAKILPLILGTSVSFHDENAFDKNIEIGRKSLEIASRIGFSAIRVFGNSIAGDHKACICRVASGIYELCRTAEKLGVNVLLEVHGDFNTLDRLLPIVSRCASSSSFGIIWDICHTHSSYSDNWLEFYKPLAQYIRHVHLKDIKNGRQVLPGDGELPIRDIVSYMINDGYDGYFSLEWEKHWYRELPPIECALDKLMAIFK